MDDIYEERPSHDYADGFIGGLIIGKHFGDFTDGADENGLHTNNEALWEDMAPRKKGLSGLIASLVRINTFLYIIAMIVVLIIVSLTQFFG